MYRRRKDISCILISLILLISLVACGGSDISSSAVPSTEPTDTIKSEVQVESEGVVTDSTTSHSITSGSLKVHYINVGQGDAELIELPNGQNMLIDAGNPNTGVTNYIKQHGIRKLDYVIVTHPHADHVGGMADVINSFSIGKVYMPKKSSTTKTFESFLDAVSNKGLSLTAAQKGVEILSTDGLEVSVLGPSSVSTDDLNDVSAIVKVVFGNTSFLFTGDASKSVLCDIGNSLRADVYKVSHHGSETGTNSTVLNYIKPKYAVISCGARNSYGHPHAECLSALQSAGVNVYRTDEVGTIIIVSDGSNYTIDKNASIIEANAPPASGGSEDVYITKTGSKYHRNGCSSLSKSKIPISKSDAIQQGFEPCKKCNP